MRLSAVTQRLRTMALLASKAVRSTSNVPVLANLLLSARADNVLTIESSDLEISIKASVQVKVDEPGQHVVDRKRAKNVIIVMNEIGIDIEQKRE